MSTPWALCWHMMARQGVPQAAPYLPNFLPQTQ